jgi:SAM-dependent methyltransferase
LAKRTNFGFQKRQKDIEKQKKKAAKAEKKKSRADGPAEDSVVAGIELEGDLGERLEALCEEGWEIFDQFDHDIRQNDFHAFVAADYPVVLESLVALRAPGRRFLEWGSATGVITIMADLLGFDAFGIEIDGTLVDRARELADRHGSRARFTTGSFLPAGYRWKQPGGDERMGTISQGDSGYIQLGMPLEDFDIVFGYPWPGEEDMMLDLMKVHGRPDAVLLIHTPTGMKLYRGGRLAA